MGRTGRGGVELRETSIRVHFRWRGEPCKETLKVNGQPMQPTAANHRYALRLVDEIRSKIRHGVFNYTDYFPDSPRADADPSTRTFGQARKLYIDSIQQLEPATVSQYTSAMNVWTDLLGEKTPIIALSHDVLAAKIGKKEWASPNLLNNYLIPLRGLFAMIYHGDKSAQNPMAGIKNAKRVKKKPDPLSGDERDRVLAHMEANFDERVVCYFIVAFYTGMRPEELIALQWGDIDWAKGLIHVQRVRTFKGSERDGTKTHAERDIDIAPPVELALARMRKWTSMGRARDGCQSPDVFQNPNTGQPWHDDRSQRDHYWTPTLRKLGIRTRRAYCTRHTYATALLMSGSNPNYVAQQLGHTTAKMVFEKYSRWIEGADGGAERKKMRATFAAPTSVRNSQDVP